MPEDREYLSALSYFFKLLGYTPPKKGEEVWIIRPGLLYSETQG